MSDPSTKKAVKAAPEQSPAKVARIRILVKKTPAKGFKFGKGQIVSRVPLAHAEYLRDEGKAEILEVGEA